MSGSAGHERGAAVTRVEAVAKAARVLQAFTPLASSLSLRQLAERTGIPRSTAHAICLTLCDAGLLEEVPGRGYRLGPALVGLGGQVIERTGLVGAAEGVLERLAPGDGLEIHLGQLVGGWVVYLDRASGPVRAPMHNRVGLRAPAHLTGCGKAALALLPLAEVAARVEAVCAAEPGPPPDLRVLARELAAPRRPGFVVSDTFQPGRTSRAAPAARRPPGRVRRPRHLPARPPLGPPPRPRPARRPRRRHLGRRPHRPG